MSEYAADQAKKGFATRVIHLGHNPASYSGALSDLRSDIVRALDAMARHEQVSCSGIPSFFRRMKTSDLEEGVD